jgi:hypothetical protein
MAEQAEQGVNAHAREDFAPTQQQQRYLSAVAKSGTLTAGCKAARVSPHTVYRWREDAAFAEEEAIARESFADALEQEAVRRAWRGVKTVRPIYARGEMVGEVVETEYSDALMVLMLKALRPEKYRERVETRQTGDIAIRVEYADPIADPDAAQTAPGATDALT